MKPTLKEEKKLWARGYKIVAGLDEAGRGPLAGPVVAASAVFNNEKLQLKNKKLLRQINDSKKLTGKKREELYEFITKCGLFEWGIGVVSEKIIDKINIKQASELAMEQALEKMEKKANKKTDFLIIDGNQLKNKKLKSIPHKLIVAADAKVFSCAASSILAKVTRDRLMLKLDKKYPKYKFRTHKGYGTKLHCRLLKKYGPCPAHRRSFSPVSFFCK